MEISGGKNNNPLINKKVVDGTPGNTTVNGDKRSGKIPVIFIVT